LKQSLEVEVKKEKLVSIPKRVSEALKLTN